MQKNNYAVVMAGGVGSRFWPVSRTTFPKQFIDILGTGTTLIQQTCKRLEKLIPAENILIVTNEIYRELIEKQLPHIPSTNILYEPVAKNTAPCIAYACHKIASQCSDANILVCPSDHIILDEPAFVEKIQAAFHKTAKDNSLITLGINPTRPDTGYGYVQFIAADEDFKKVKTFTEKPNLELAKTFIESGDFLWNAGIFVWTAKAIHQAFEAYLPDMQQLFAEGESEWYTANEKAFINRIYPLCESISIDYGIMEKAKNVYVLPSSFGWSDLGTWGSLHDVSQKDYVGNVSIGTDKAMMYDASNCMVFAPKGKTVVIKDLNDYIVADTGDVLLICPTSQEQEIKKIVAEIKSKYGEKLI